MRGDGDEMSYISIWDSFSSTDHYIGVIVVDRIYIGNVLKLPKPSLYWFIQKYNYLFKLNLYIVFFV